MKNYFGYQEKVCVVTGAASGMGRATAEMLIDLGAKVYALDWAKVDLEGIEKYIHTDLSKKESIDQAFAIIPDTIDSFFGIAGVSGMKNDFNQTVHIDYVANKYITETYLIERMKENASIAFITSTAGLGWEKEDNKSEYLPIITTNGWEDTVSQLEKLDLNNLPGPFGYSFSKLAMNYYVAYLQNKFAPKKIRVNAILPASTETGLTNEFGNAVGGAENLLKYTGNAQRLATSREMAEPIVFINSQMASYISGVLLSVDYGSEIETRSGIKQDALSYTFKAIKESFAHQE